MTLYSGKSHINLIHTTYYAAAQISGHGVAEARMQKWRNERNFWICLCGVIVYWCLKRFAGLERQIRELRRTRGREHAD